MGGLITRSAILGAALLMLLATCAAAQTYYIDSGQGADSNNGTSPASAWQTLGRVQAALRVGPPPGTKFLFKRGAVWSGENGGGLTLPTGVSGTASNPITFSNFGTGPLPVFDGQGTNPACFYARAAANGSIPWSYITIDGFECRNQAQYGVLFYQNQGGSAGMPGIVVKHMNIHNTGPGAYAGATVGPDSRNFCATVGAGRGTDCEGNAITGTITAGACDDCHYRNQLMFLDENTQPDGVQFIDNTVTDCGGHNCIQVQKDTGSPLIKGNTVSGWVHNGIDVKAVKGARVTGNTVNGPSNHGVAFYIENTQLSGGADVTWTFNLIRGGVEGAFECEWGDSGTPSSLGTACRGYNNTFDDGAGGSGTAVATNGDRSCGNNISLDFRNNIFNSTSMYYQTRSCTNTWTWNYNDKCAMQASCPTASGQPIPGPHDLTQINPGWFNQSGAYYNLKPGSPLSSAGRSGLTSTSNIGAS